jgi:hypothetical protein
MPPDTHTAPRQLRDGERPARFAQLFTVQATRVPDTGARHVSSVGSPHGGQGVSDLYPARRPEPPPTKKTSLARPRLKRRPCCIRADSSRGSRASRGPPLQNRRVMRNRPEPLSNRHSRPFLMNVMTFMKPFRLLRRRSAHVALLFEWQCCHHHSRAGRPRTGSPKHLRVLPQATLPYTAKHSDAPAGPSEGDDCL